MQLTGLVAGAWMWLRMADAATGDTPFALGKQATAEFYADYLMPEAVTFETRILAGASSMDALDSGMLVAYA